MKLRTRLLITFVAIILLPLLLSYLTYGTVKLVTKQAIKRQYGINKINTAMLVNPIKGFSDLTREEYEELFRLTQTNQEKLITKTYLKHMDERLSEKATGLLVIVGDEVLYRGDRIADDMVEDILQSGVNPSGGYDGYYVEEREILIKYLIFYSQEGEQGKVFLVTKVHNILSKGVLISIFLVILIVLFVTSLFLTRWIHKGVFKPMAELNVAMQHVSEGDFDYVMSTKMHGEIGEVYENFEQMRLRIKESAEERVEADNKNRELISNISHDLKTPITSIKGYVEGIMDGVADTPEKMDRYIKTIYNKTNDMTKLINELTIYSGIDSNRIPYNFRKLNVTDYFDDCVEEVGVELESRSIKLNYINTVPKGTIVIADAEQLKRVVNNIISNSVKYMNKSQKEIEIRLLDEIDSVRVEIEDNGKGVSAKEIGSIFERFYRTDASRNSAQGGSGIELSIVKKIVEDHGGYIWATSKEGEGTCMHFVLRKYVDRR